MTRRPSPWTASGACAAPAGATCRCWPPCVLLLVMYGIGVVAVPGVLQHPGHASTSSSTTAFLLVVAVGMTFVILTGGIDLSVGSVVAMTAMVSASLLDSGLAAPAGDAGRAG